MNNKIKEHNVETGEIVERDMTSEEITSHNKTLEEMENFKAEINLKEERKKSAQQKLLDLGLTEEEVQSITNI